MQTGRAIRRAALAYDMVCNPGLAVRRTSFAPYAAPRAFWAVDAATPGGEWFAHFRWLAVLVRPPAAVLAVFWRATLFKHLLTPWLWARLPPDVRAYYGI